MYFQLHGTRQQSSENKRLEKKNLLVLLACSDIRAYNMHVICHSEIKRMCVLNDASFTFIVCYFLLCGLIQTTLFISTSMVM